MNTYKQAMQLMADRTLADDEVWPCAYRNQRHDEVRLAVVVEGTTPCCRECSALYMRAEPEYVRKLRRAAEIIRSHHADARLGRNAATA